MEILWAWNNAQADANEIMDSCLMGLWKDEVDLREADARNDEFWRELGLEGATADEQRAELDRRAAHQI